MKKVEPKPLKVLLLLSGGQDSALALRNLLSDGYEVVALCIDGQQGREKRGAIQASQHHGTPLIIHSIPWFDETTWNPLLLIIRDLAMLKWSFIYARKHHVQYLATGVKRSDIQNPALFWLGPFLLVIRIFLWLFGLKALFPVWESGSSKISKFRKVKRKFNQIAIQTVPSSIRRKIFFSKLDYFPPESEIVIHPANDPEDQEQALSLLWESYAQEGFVEDVQKKRVVLLLQQLLPTTVNLVAKNEGKVVGTICVYRSGAGGLPSEKIFDIDPLKSQYPVIVEVGSLAIDPGFRRNRQTNIIFDLMTYTFNFAPKYFSADAAIISIYPYHEDFYRFLMGFKRAPGTKVEIYFRKPAALMLFDVYSSQFYFREMYKAHRKLELFYLQALGATPERFHLDTPLSHNRIVPERLITFIERQLETDPDLFQKMTFREFAAFENYFQQLPQWQQIKDFFPYFTSTNRKERRYDVKLEASLKVEGTNYAMSILDLSESGLKLFSKADFTDDYVGKTGALELQIRDEWISVNADIVWVKGVHLGLCIRSGKDFWRKVANHIGGGSEATKCA